MEAFSGLWEFFKLSLASGVMLCLENWYYKILLLMTGQLENATVAVDALSVCMTINGWEMMIPFAFFVGTGVRVANELGAGKWKSAKFAMQVLAYDAKNLKALYRRGQAYKERGLLQDAVTDLSNALEVSPDDDIIGELLRDTKEQLIKEGGHCALGRLVIEEITEEVENVPSGNNRNSSTEQTIDQPKKSGDSSKSYNIANNGNLKSNSDTDPATLASLNIGQSQEVSPDMIKASSDMIGKMSPEELQKMFDMASSFQGNNPFLRGGSSDSPFNSGSVPPNVTPDMLKTATDMISKMPPDDLKKMFEMASLMKGKESIPSAAAVDKKGRNLSQSNFPSSSTTRAFGESSSSDNAFSNIINASEPNFPSSSTDLQEQMRNQMKDPAMRQVDVRRHVCGLGIM
ncbi:hypothetical protein RYX36_027103 [Vicia faba]